MSVQLRLFETGNISAAWHVRISRRARRLSVRVYPGGRVEVVVPPGASAIAVQRFVGTHRAWIDRRVADLSAAHGPLSQLRPTSIGLSAINRRYLVDYEPAPASSETSVAHVRLVGEGCLLVSGALEDGRVVARALQRWLQEVAQTELGRELAGLSQQYGFNFRRVQIRRQRTRWGSCSVAGTISLNMCLLFQDPAVLRYLLIHELSHTRHMNHSARFWALVQSLQPDYRRLDRELLRGWQRVPGWVFN
jgi:predicted metal-dependent hydrolase